MAKITGIVHDFYLRTRLKNWDNVYSILYVEIIARICNNWWLCKYIYETNLGFEPRWYNLRDNKNCVDFIRCEKRPQKY
jgi:hypothetical protein